MINQMFLLQSAEESNWQGEKKNNFKKPGT